MKYTAAQIKQWDTAIQTNNGKWKPARPNSVLTLFGRLYYAWGVVTGKYDILDWEDQS